MSDALENPTPAGRVADGFHLPAHPDRPVHPSDSPNRPWRRYVAIGDSMSEGLNDPDPHTPDAYVGWTDRLAHALATLVPGAVDETGDEPGDTTGGEPGREPAGGVFRYANLAIRGKLIADITSRQLDEALALGPDLVSMVAGGNDILRPKADIDAIARRLERAVARIRATGADVLLATPTDPKDAPVINLVRSRHAIYTAHIWTIARRHGCAVIDQFGMTALRDWRMWGDDRIHMTSEGHARVAGAALAALGCDITDAMTSIHPDWATPLPPRVEPTRKERWEGDREWARAHLGPWVQRRLKGVSSGDNRTPKRPTLEIL